MQRTLSELQRDGLLYSERTTGRYVTEDRERIHDLKERLAVEMAENFFRDMRQIGYERKETIEQLHTAVNRE